MNNLLVGCHQDASASAPIVVQHGPGAVQDMDVMIVLADGTWHREPTQRCWVRTMPGPIACTHPTLAQAQDYARPLSPTPVRTQPPPPPTAIPTAVVMGCPRGCTSPPPGCLIKGNISFETGERIYHVPGGQFYNAIVINPNQGERWFCTEQEAINNGWRRGQR